MVSNQKSAESFRTGGEPSRRLKKYSPTGAETRALLEIDRERSAGTKMQKELDTVCAAQGIGAAVMMALAMACVSEMGAVFALASETINITMARPDAIAAGMRFTFAVAETLIVVALARRVDVGLYTLDDFYHDAPPEQGLFFGYGAIETLDIEPALDRVKAILTEIA